LILVIRYEDNIMTETTAGCVHPGEIAADDLVAYARGEAAPAVVAHVERCPACRDEAASYTRLDHVLSAGLFRLHCPETIVLGEYALGMLPPARAREIAEHLVECRHCLAERQSFGSYLAESDEVPLPGGAGVLTTLRRLLARPIVQPSALALGLRGSASDESTTYEADGLHVTLSVQRAARAGKAVLVGLVEEAASRGFGGRAILLAGDRELQAQAVDDLGNFVFEDVPSGSYRVEVTVPDAVVVLDAITV
jgi:hypothetical protein